MSESSVPLNDTAVPLNDTVVTTPQQKKPPARQSSAEFEAKVSGFLAGRGGGAGGGRGGGAWAKLRGAVHREDESKEKEKQPGLASLSRSIVRKGREQRPNMMTAKSFKFSTRNLLNNRGEKALPEEGGDLHKHFRTCASLTRIREEFRNSLNDDAEKRLGRLMDSFSKPEEGTGRLLLHSLGLNSELIKSGGGAAAAQTRVNQFVMQELLPANPSAIVEEDDKGRIPFVEPIITWIEARRAVRKWKADTERTREKVALVAAKLQRKMGQAAAAGHRDSDSDSESATSSITSSKGGCPRPRNRRTTMVGSRSFFSGLKHDQKQARLEMKLIVESADDAMFCIDEMGKILITNHAAVKQFGYTRKEMLNNNIAMICNAKDSARHHEYLAHYVKTGEKRVMGKKRELLARRKDGSTFYIELGLTEINMGGGKFIFVGFVKDLTEVKRHRSSLEYQQSARHLGEGDENQEEAGEGGSRGNQARGIPPLVEWCLTILSEFVDNHAFINTGHSDDERDDDESSLSSSGIFKSFRGFGQDGTPVQMRDTMVVENVASIPNLLEELLLIEDQEARSRVFDMSIVHKVLFNIDSLGDGNWLIDMLDKAIRVQKTKYIDSNLSGADNDTAEGRAFQLQLKMAQERCRFLADAAIFYLEQVSKLNIKDDLFVFHHLQMQQEVSVSQNGGMADMISTGDVHHFEKHRNELFDAVGGLNGLVRCICVLEDDFVKRAAATPVIRRLLDKVMFSPFATLAALFDGINHFLLMISFRLGPAPALFHLAKDDDSFHSQQYLLANASLLASVVYFVTKTVQAGLAKHALSENLFWQDAFSFWNLLDTVPLLMVLLCSIAVDITLRQRTASDGGDSGDIPFFLRTCVAITTPLLWLRIMAFVKVRNKQLATFILCTVEIMKDIKWFLLVLFAAMASFAQMWVSLTFDPSQSENEVYMEGYLKAYTMMLGDLDSDALRTHPLIAVLFVVYTFGVTVVLLNILIAIVSDSYQNSFVSSKMMLGKARVMFVSELLSVRTFHNMWMKGKTGNTRRNVNYVCGIVVVTQLWMITETINQKLGLDCFCNEGISPNAIKLEAIVAFLFLFAIMFAKKVIIGYVLNEFNDTGGLKSNQSVKSLSRFQRALTWFVQTSFSALSSSFDSLFDREDSHQEYGDSSDSHETHRSDKAIQKSIEKTKKTLKSELKTVFDQMQLSLREMEERQQDDMASIEDLISNAIADAMAEARQQAVLLNNENANKMPDRRAASGRIVQISEADIEAESMGENSSHSSLSLGHIDLKQNQQVQLTLQSHQNQQVEQGSLASESSPVTRRKKGFLGKFSSKGSRRQSE